jgi:hypothetical protein
MPADYSEPAMSEFQWPRLDRVDRLETFEAPAFKRYDILQRLLPPERSLFVLETTR